MDDRMTESAPKVNAQVDELIRRMNAKAVFGEPIQQGDTTLIPVASITYGFGMRPGLGPQPEAGRSAGRRSRHRAGRRSGRRRWGRVAWPGRWATSGSTKTARSAEPTMNMTLVSIGGMLMVAWNVFWVMKMIRDDRRSRERLKIRGSGTVIELGRAERVMPGEGADLMTMLPFPDAQPTRCTITPVRAPSPHHSHSPSPFGVTWA